VNSIQASVVPDYLYFVLRVWSVTYLLCRSFMETDDSYVLSLVP